MESKEQRRDYAYERILVIGSGQLAYKCAVTAKQYVQDVEVLEWKLTESTVLEKLCGKAEIPYRQVSKEELQDRLLQEQKQTLVVSAANAYLIPQAVIAKENLTIVNWHNALLPYHKGRNAESWVIYEGEAKTGVTWHYIVPDVDAGDILLQEEIPLEDTMTALKLYQKQCQLGEVLFERLIEPLLRKECVGRKQPQVPDGQLHYSYQRPNQGVLDLNWSMEDISRFLRAMDYGSLQLLGKCLVRWEGKNYSFYRYKIKQVEEEFGEGRKVEWEENQLKIIEKNKVIVLRDLQEE